MVVLAVSVSRDEDGPASLRMVDLHDGPQVDALLGRSAGDGSRDALDGVTDRLRHASCVDAHECWPWRNVQHHVPQWPMCREHDWRDAQCDQVPHADDGNAKCRRASRGRSCPRWQRHVHRHNNEWERIVIVVDGIHDE